MAEILEDCMVVCFGASWPISIYKSFVSRTTKGKSIFFSLFVLVGYACGICSKIVGSALPMCLLSRAAIRT